MGLTKFSAAVKLLRILPAPLMLTVMLFSVSGFVPIEDKVAEQNATAYKMRILQEIESATAHNLIVDKNELRCLAMNIYFEARSEPLDGKLAVAGVTLNRMNSEKFPDTICGVVKHSKSARLHRCQFSWWCDGKKDEPKELAAWMEAQQLARLYLAGIYSDPTQNALWYHADYVNPDWASRLHQTAKIGRHLFYTAEPKATTYAMF